MLKSEQEAAYHEQERERTSKYYYEKKHCRKVVVHLM